MNWSGNGLALSRPQQVSRLDEVSILLPCEAYSKRSRKLDISSERRTAEHYFVQKTPHLTGCGDRATTSSLAAAGTIINGRARQLREPRRQ